MMQASDLFDLPSHFPFHDYFDPEASPWEWVKAIRGALASFDFIAKDSERELPPGVILEGDVFLHPTVKLPPYAVIQGPTWIGPETEIRPGAYIRGNVIVGQGCVLGNSCEYKNCLLMDEVESAHFNYVGDSILGTGAHLGAGVILANLRLDRGAVPVAWEGGRMTTDLKKLGAMVGEYAEVGCNAVLQPGTIIGKRSIIAPTVAYGGFLREDSIAADPSRSRTFPRR